MFRPKNVIYSVPLNISESDEDLKIYVIEIKKKADAIAYSPAHFQMARMLIISYAMIYLIPHNGVDNPQLNQYCDKLVYLMKKKATVYVILS